MESEVHCPKCSKTWNSNERVPRRLPCCGHVCCELCIRKQLDRNNMWMLTCPGCGAKQELPLHNRMSELRVQKDYIRLATVYNNVKFLKGGAPIQDSDMSRIRKLSRGELDVTQDAEDLFS